MSRPCEILGDVNAEELIAVYPLHRCLVDGDGCVYSALSPEIQSILALLVLKCSSTLFLYCRLAALMDLLRS